MNVDTTLLARDPFHRRRYTTGLLVAVSSLALSSALVVGNYSDHSNNVAFWSQLALGLCLAVVSTTLLRRPVMYFEGQVVDGQLTCSAMHRSACPQ